MTECEVRGYIKGTIKLLEKDEEGMEEYHNDLHRELTGAEYQDYGFLMGRLFACRSILELVEEIE